MLRLTKLLLILSILLFIISCKKDESTPATEEELRASVKSSLWAYYNFNEGSLDDKSGNNHRLTTVNGVKFNQDMWGNDNSVIEFNGINSYAVIDDGKTFPDGDFTISFFMMPKKVGGSIFQKANFQDGKGASILIALEESTNSGRLLFNSNRVDNPCSNPISFVNTSTLINKKPINADAWYQITVVSQNDLIRTYINAYHIDAKSIPSKMIKNCNSAPFYLGISSMADMKPFMGRIDNLRIFTKALTELEIEHLFWAQY